MTRQILLLDDVYGLGHKGDIVPSTKIKPGYMRNLLSPKGLAVVADKGTLRMRERLQKEREEQAKVDKTRSEKIAEALNGKEFTINVKIDPSGHMYGSVSLMDVLALLKKEMGVEIERHFIRMAKPIKMRGRHSISLVLKEGVPAECFLIVLGEEETELTEIEPEPVVVEEVAAPAKEEAEAPTEE